MRKERGLIGVAEVCCVVKPLVQGFAQIARGRLSPDASELQVEHAQLVAAEPTPNPGPCPGNCTDAPWLGRSLSPPDDVKAV